MNTTSPSSAAPAAAASTTSGQQLDLVSLPSPSTTWQRQYARLPATRTSSAPARLSPNLPMAISSTPGSASDFLIGNTVYQSLIRPKLLRGGEWQLSMVNNLMAAGLGTMAVVTWNWRFLIGAAFFAWPLQWLIRMLGRHDPQFWQIYFRTRQRRSSANPTAGPATGPPRRHASCPSSASLLLKLTHPKRHKDDVMKINIKP